MSKLADAAFEWMKLNAAPEGVSSKDLWEGLRAAYPDLTQVSPTRKTPRNTLIRDLRLDAWGRFKVEKGMIKLLKPNWRPGDKTFRQLMRP